MRNLEDWEGKKILFTGFVENWKAHKQNNLGNVLLSNLTLRLVDKPAKRYFQHLWVHNLHSFGKIEPNLERLHQVYGTAVVIKYRRKDFTWDYSFTCLTGKYFIDKVLQDLNYLILKNAPRKKIKQKAEFMLELLESKEFIVKSLDFDYQRRLDYCKNIITKLEKYK